MQLHSITFESILHRLLGPIEGVEFYYLYTAQTQDYNIFPFSKKSKCSFKPRMMWLKNIGIPCVIDLLDILEFTYLLQKMIYLYTGEALGESQRVKSV